ncbi:hypothetical protein G7K_6319-t1 [Saitoella complicata NRRL Y-17804]|uniref:4Fe-4S Mo/W bis-MGD-type domain-containing protein n=2 Tax=Saitoella complicata (strain BCRC 22490 / CBS 7301 / JCM 7358 / NBRC 10748 / NRRL Y-17804) TaxID=698492 RepID=A0A0E9NQT2_SAICN|nr:hypothetical protein G7K_6319-t1 [Saitoella complicata NRRL Y-17804]
MSPVVQGKDMKHPPASSIEPSRPEPAEKDVHQSRDSIKDIWGERNGYNANEGIEWPERIDERWTEKPEKWVQSACVLCSNGCGMDIGVKSNKIVGVRGRGCDRVNKGRLGPKGLHGWIANHSKDRLLYPLIRKNGKLERSSWEEAMSLIVEKTKAVQKELTSHGIGFYTSGQLFLEEYYTLAVIGKAGLGTLHMDGNTRLCTATAAAAMRENFGSDGQPGSYTDIDYTDCVMLVGHNMSSTQTVLWSRILDRLAGPNPPKIIVIDPRLSETAKKATVHLAPRIGTNLALLNGLQRELIENGWVDWEWVNKHTIGIDDVRKIVGKWTLERTSEVTGVPVEKLREAARIIGTTPRLLSTALQGVYQSNQATASACAINNINLLRGMIGKPGCGVYQMNGQPTAQNNREAGCDGEYPGFRNNMNKDHMQDLADHWNIDLIKLPHWNQPTHIMDMLHFIEMGQMKMFWISGTNPLVSLPDLERVRKLLTKPDMFVVVQDCFMTESAQIADVVLPAAIWAEKTGCFTNVDRTVHLSHQAIDPPGECRSDFDIWCDYAKRMDFRDKNGDRLVHWSKPEEAFEAWKKCTKGRPCDYTAMTYEKLTGGSGIQWPCNDENPVGTERLYTDGVFPTDVDHAESWGHDLQTGTPVSLSEYKTMNPAGRAIFKGCEYRPQEEVQNEEYPFRLSTGRNVFMFHTRTKTARARHLREAAPEPYIQLNEEDAKGLEIEDGDMCLVTSRRGAIELKANVGDMSKGQVFVPFHYGYWDSSDGRSRAANELTVNEWDFVSKQPTFKSGAVRVEKFKDKEGEVKIHARERHSAAIHKVENKEEEQKRLEQEDRVRHLEDFIGLMIETNITLVELYESLIEKHQTEKEIQAGLKVLRDFARMDLDLLQPVVEKYGWNEKDAKSDSDILRKTLFPPSRTGSGVFDVLMDMQGLFVFLANMEGIVTALAPAASALLDQDFVDVVQQLQQHVRRQRSWAAEKLKVKGPQTLIVPVPQSEGRL